MKDPNSTRTTNLGIGFRERDAAFDFKNSLNEYVRYVDRMSAAEQMAKEVTVFYVITTAVFSYFVQVEQLSLENPEVIPFHYDCSCLNSI